MEELKGNITKLKCSWELDMFPDYRPKDERAVLLSGKTQAEGRKTTKMLDGLY